MATKLLETENIKVLPLGLTEDEVQPMRRSSIYVYNEYTELWWAR